MMFFSRLRFGVWPLLMIAHVSGQAGEVAIPASDDTWTHGLSSTSIEGSGNNLAICPVAGYWIYLKFDLGGVSAPITGAQLQMSRFSGSRPEEISAYLVSDDGWSESTLNGPNRPAPQSPENATSLATGEVATGFDQWSSPALTAAVVAEAAGDGTLSLMVREDPDSNFDVRRYYSNDAAVDDALKPRLVLTTAEGETVATGWTVAAIGAGTKPSFDFDAAGRFHVMGMFERNAGDVWYATADRIGGPWGTRVVKTEYFYGPGDLRAADDGTAHLAVHNHTAQSPDHSIYHPDGTITNFVLSGDDFLHDGWDNALAFGPDGTLHQSCVFPNAFGGADCLQYATFDGAVWTFETSVPGSGSFMYGLNTSIAIDRQGNPHIAYCQASDWATPGDLKYATQSGGEWTVTTVVTGGPRGRFPSIATDHWDRPHIAWLDIDADDPTLGTVRYGVFNSGAWDIEDVDTLDAIELGFSGARKSVSLALDSQWRPHVAYGDRERVAYAVKPFADWERTDIVRHSAPSYNGLVVLRLNTSDEPAIVFWQPASENDGLVRLAGLQDPRIELLSPVINPDGTLTLAWSTAPDGLGYVVEARDSLTEGDWEIASGPTPLIATTWTDTAFAGEERFYRVRTVALSE